MLPFGNICHLNVINVGQYMHPPTTYRLASMCSCSTYLYFDHLELFCRDRIRIINALKVFLCFFNEAASLLVYKPVLIFSLVILNGYNT